MGSLKIGNRIGKKFGDLIIKINVNGSFSLTLGSGYIYDCSINWGDGNKTIVNQIGTDNNITHTYTAGIYFIKINGIFESLDLSNNLTKLFLGVIQKQPI
jgi:hypothetical protein